MAGQWKYPEAALLAWELTTCKSLCSTLHTVWVYCKHSGCVLQHLCGQWYCGAVSVIVCLDSSGSLSVSSQVSIQQRLALLHLLLEDERERLHTWASPLDADIKRRNAVRWDVHVAAAWATHPRMALALLERCSPHLHSNTSTKKVFLGLRLCRETASRCPSLRVLKCWSGARRGYTVQVPCRNLPEASGRATRGCKCSTGATAGASRCSGTLGHTSCRQIWRWCPVQSK